MPATPRFSTGALALRIPLLAALLVAGSLACHNYSFESPCSGDAICIYDDLFTVSVVDADRTVAAGYHGSVYWTENGGESWSRAEVPGNRLIYSLSMADAKYGWAVGQLGTILRTQDGGKTWEEQANHKRDEGSHLFGVHAVDANTAWVVGEWGTRILTEDGGRTWQDHSLSIDLAHPMFVWLTMTDQDRVRQGKVVYEDVGLNNVFCLDSPSQKCWLVGEFGYIFYSEDRGQTWERGEILGDVRVDPVTYPFNEIELGLADRERLEAFAAQIADENHLNVLIDPFASPKEMEAFGNPEDPSELFDVLSARIDEVRSVLEEAGILSDRMRMPNKPPWDFEDFLEDDPTFLQRYLDGRLAEAPRVNVSVIQNPYLFTINFRDEEHGLVAGLGGVILRTQDGGKTWEYTTTDRKQALFSVAAINGRAMAVGEKGLIRYSVDEGVTWRPPADSVFDTIFTFMRDLDFDRSGKVGMIVGQNGMILRSEDGGESWSQVLPPEDGSA